MIPGWRDGGENHLSISNFFKEWSYDRISQFAASVVAGKEMGCMERSGKDFDPRVVEAFVTGFRKGGMEVPDLVV